MRFGAYCALFAMFIQTAYLPAQMVEEMIERVAIGEVDQFGQDLVTADGETVFFLMDGQLTRNDMMPTGIGLNADFLGRGFLDMFGSPAIGYVEGMDDSVVIHAMLSPAIVKGQDGTKLDAPVSGDVAAVLKFEQPALNSIATLLCFLAWADGESLPNGSTGRVFAPTLGAFGFADLPSPGLLPIMLWGELFGAEANQVVAGAIGANLFAPAVFTSLGLAINTDLLDSSNFFNRFKVAFLRLRLACVVMAVSVLALANADLLPPEIAFIGILNKLAFTNELQVQFARSLVAALLFTHLMALPGHPEPTALRRFLQVFELRHAFGAVAMATGRVELEPGGASTKMAVWASTASQRRDAMPEAAQKGPGRPGDLNGDQIVDAADFGEFAGCFTWPDRPMLLDLRCAEADLDGDHDVDHLDFSILIEQYDTPAFDPQFMPLAGGEGAKGPQMFFDTDYVNAGLAILILKTDDPIPGYPDALVSFFQETQANGQGDAVIRLSTSVGEALVGITNESMFTPLMTGQDLGDGVITSLNRLSNMNASGQFSVMVGLDNLQTAIYKITARPGDGNRARSAWELY